MRRRHRGQLVIARAMWPVAMATLVGACIASAPTGINRITDGTGAMAGGAHERAAQEHIVPVDGADAERIEAAMDFSWMPSRARSTQRNAGSSDGCVATRCQVGMP